MRNKTRSPTSEKSGICGLQSSPIELRLGWLINPQEQQVKIYRPGQSVEVVAIPTLLSGEEMLPEFEL
ncbi:MAG: Uma2 family endonuclease [Komarekiella atlantica HA4396-MV6]|nr:Uma2 family endonuclease [Komarekiella atlantica HA4396-MV6]